MSPVNPIDVAARPAALAASLRAHLGAVAWTRVLQVGALGAEQGADVCLVGGAVARVVAVGCDVAGVAELDLRAPIREAKTPQIDDKHKLGLVVIDAHITGLNPLHLVHHIEGHGLRLVSELKVVPIHRPGGINLLEHVRSTIVHAQKELLAH